MLAFNILRSITAAIRNSAIGQPRTVPNHFEHFVQMGSQAGLDDILMRAKVCEYNTEYAFSGKRVRRCRDQAARVAVD